MPHERDAEAILADWYGVQRDRQEVKVRISEGESLHAELEHLHAEARRLRDEYAGLVAYARRHRMVLAPFPTTVGPDRKSLSPAGRST